MKTVKEKTDKELAEDVTALVATIHFDLSKGRPVWSLADVLSDITAEQCKRHNAKLRAVGSEVFA